MGVHMKNDDLRAKSSCPVPSRSDHQILAVVLHGYTFTPENMKYVVEVTRETVPGAHLLTPQLPLSRFSTVDPVQIARHIIALIEEQISFRVAQGWEPFREITLIGHSCGALLARKVYVLAGPESWEARFEDSSDEQLSNQKSWFPLIKRIILLAGMNRGWSLTHHLHIARMIALRVGTIFADVASEVTHTQFMISRLRRGAPFITELRLQWL